jgi:hypothetical protein
VFVVLQFVDSERQVAEVAVAQRLVRSQPLVRPAQERRAVQLMKKGWFHEIFKLNLFSSSSSFKRPD